MSFLSKLAFFNHYAVPKEKQTTFRDYQTDVKNEAAVLNGDLVFLFQLNQKLKKILYCMDNNEANSN